MREVFVTELVKEILGPRNGIREDLDESPLTEYVTGVLGPILNGSVRDIESATELPSFDEGYTSEEVSEDTDVQAPPFLPPPLDPKSRPPSIGLTFVVSASGNPVIDVCAVWSRYTQVPGPRWVRAPRIFTTRLSESDQVIWLNSEGRQVSREALA